ncbi:hypothetical protein KX816_19025 [Sphingosinicellaceae bacterium]|nr:hypothetical protein KX816_19025 [Sphingosinicellaceae bacterium]
MFAASLVAIAVLVGICWALGFRGEPVLADAAEAERVADAALTGFRARDAILAENGHGALLRGDDGRLVAVRPVGDRWLVRVLGPDATRDGDRLVLPREAGARAALTLPESQRWAAWL